MRNKVIQIEDQHGKLCTDSNNIQMGFFYYDKDLLGSRNPTENIRTAILNRGPCCTQEQANSLMLPVTNEEIKRIFFGTPIDKSSGPEGYTSGFFKDAWDVVGSDICDAIKDSSQLVMTYIRTTSFTLSLNGSSFGYFKGQRGIRQGDPISPLIFTLCMDFLTRTIKYATTKWPFQYHPLCKELKLTHLMFVDDLLLFCKGIAQSVMLILKAFSTFSKASGLSMNNSKYEVYFNGMAATLKEDIKQVTGFIEGQMPFRVPLVGWDTVTLPKTEGGLGIKKDEIWNVAIVAKLVDWIYSKAGRL
ncbi:uncharacterized protein LOC141607664 [Silene latifolia]|uniref:uncharacterized protein LOC141607664 n=1 Tax=Silene latifolia TaxID=37657 RepID=UPI003D770646